MSRHVDIIRLQELDLHRQRETISPPAPPAAQKHASAYNYRSRSLQLQTVEIAPAGRIAVGLVEVATRQRIERIINLAVTIDLKRDAGSDKMFSDLVCGSRRPGVITVKVTGDAAQGHLHRRRKLGVGI